MFRCCAVPGHGAQALLDLLSSEQLMIVYCVPHRGGAAPVAAARSVCCQHAWLGRGQKSGFQERSCSCTYVVANKLS